MRTSRYGWLGAVLLWALAGVLLTGAAWAGSAGPPRAWATATAKQAPSAPPDPTVPPAPTVPPGPTAPPDPTVPPLAGAWPVGLRPVVLRGWDPPATPYGRGHRGVDLASPQGTPVRAVAPGRVSFAGRVAGRGVVSLDLTGTGDPPLRTTYEPVRASVKAGTEVTAGDILGTLDSSPHCGGPSCLHWGLRRGDTYLNPLSLLPPWLRNNAPPRLLPVLGVPLPE